MTEQKIRTFEHAIADAMVRIRALIDEYAGWGPETLSDGVDAIEGLLALGRWLHAEAQWEATWRRREVRFEALGADTFTEADIDPHDRHTRQVLERVVADIEAEAAFLNPDFLVGPNEISHDDRVAAQTLRAYADRLLTHETLAAPDREFDHDRRILAEVLTERARQLDKWGEQNHPALFDDTPEQRETYRLLAEYWKDENARRVAHLNAAGASPDRNGAWDGIELEELFEALAEPDPEKARAEWIQVAAVAVAAIGAIDRRGGATP